MENVVPLRKLRRLTISEMSTLADELCDICSEYATPWHAEDKVDAKYYLNCVAKKCRKESTSSEFYTYILRTVRMHNPNDRAKQIKSFEKLLQVLPLKFGEHLSEWIDSQKKHIRELAHIAQKISRREVIENLQKVLNA